MKKFTFILTSMLFLLVGGVFSQSVTTLYLDGGNSNSLSDQVYTDTHVTGAIVTFNGNGFYGTYSAGLSGSNWVADYHEGETHSFTINLNEGAPAGFHFYIAPKYYDNFNDGNAPKYKNVTIPEGEKSITINLNSTDCPALLEQGTEQGNGKGTYKYVWIINEGSYGAKLNIASITRTITTASSVAAPTISPASGTYDGDLTVTITKGAGNEKVVYSVSGATTGNEIDAEFTADSKTLTLTGTGIITVTAKGVVGSNESSKETRTYTYDSDIPSGKTSIESDNHTFPYTFIENYNDNIEFKSSRFNNGKIVIGNYVVLDIDVAADNTWFCFKKNWGNSPFDQCTSIYSGNSANDCLVNQNDKYWWMKISDQYAVNAFGDNVQIVGSKNKNTDDYSAMTVNSFSIYESKAFSESENNTIASKINNVVVELTRSFKKDTWNTVCLPFSLTPAQATQLFGSDYQLAEFTSVSGTTMKFTTAASFKAGVPYLVKPTIDVSYANPVVLVDVDITAKNPTPVTFGNYTFTGTFITKTFTDDNECNTSRFVATGNELKKPTKNSTLKSLRCYFTVPVAAARSLSFDIDEEGGTTSINTVQGSGVMVNGYYNLAGQRVAQPTKGLYIVNGKKVVIK